VCVCERVFLKTSPIFGKTGNRHAFFLASPRGRKRAANLTISSARRVFLEPAGYKSNGRRRTNGSHKGVFRSAADEGTPPSTYYRVRGAGRSSRLRRSDRFGNTEVINGPKSRWSGGH